VISGLRGFALVRSEVGRRDSCMIGRWPGHNFSVAARSLLMGEINLGLPRDFNKLRVAKISRFATSALTAGKQPLYCMAEPTFAYREHRFNLVL
jgi:hypothetical protein